MGCFLGIDGGGTRTVAWLGDTDGRPLARAETGPSNPHKVGLARAEREILKAFRICMNEGGFPTAAARLLHPPLLCAVCAGISGVERPGVYRPLLAWIRRNVPARHHLLTSDAAIALAAAVRDAPGAIVIAGTGSIAYARDSEGKLLRAGGWGVPFDDQGSGYDLGRKAVAAALQAFDGRGPQTQLANLICQHLGLGDITEIVSKQLEPRQVAALFPLVSEAARNGDLVARQLCRNAARDLADLASALVKRAGLGRRATLVVTSGGVFKSSIAVRRAFGRCLHRIAPKVQVETLEIAPVEGALWLARNLANKRLLRKTAKRR